MSSILGGKIDVYGGVIVDVNSLPSNRDEFDEVLGASLIAWVSEKRRGVWLKIPIEKSELIPVAVKHSFVFHHAEKNYLLLTRWLPEEENTLPEYASHTIGIGGFVYDEKTNRVVVISEKYADRPFAWKLPGGYVKAGEKLSDAVVREVKEECGVDAEFLSVISFRHTHPLLFDKSDIYFVALLKPLSFELTPQQTEIHACQWMELPAYITDPNVNSLNRAIAEIVQNAVNNNSNHSNSNTDGTSGTMSLAEFRPVRTAPPESWIKTKTFYELYTFSSST